MRKGILTFVIAAMAVCANAQTHVQNHCCTPETMQQRMEAETCDTTIKRNNISPSTLIIFYTGKNKHILKAAKKIGAEVLYAYKNFNAVAIRKPDAWTLEQTKAYFEGIKGVVQVNYDGEASPYPSKGGEMVDTFKR